MDEERVDMSELYCSMCYSMSLLAGKEPIRMQARLVLNGQSVCEAHVEKVLMENDPHLLFIIESSLGRKVRVEK